MPRALYTAVQIPEIVRQAQALADQLGFPRMPTGHPVGDQGPPSVCIPEVGRLLQALAAAKPGGLIGELGTGAGIGTAWLASGLSAGACLISAELHPHYAAAVTQLFADHPNVEIRVGDWHDVMRTAGPFDLLFMDAPLQVDLQPTQWDRITALIKVGGQIVMRRVIAT